MTNYERENAEEEFSLLRRKHKVNDLMCSLMDMVQETRIEFYAKKAQIEREAELHMELEENLNMRWDNRPAVCRVSKRENHEKHDKLQRPCDRKKILRHLGRTYF